MVACAEGHLGIDDDLHPHLGLGGVEGCSDEARTFTEEDGLEVVLLPLLIPVDVGEFLEVEGVGKARHGEGVKYLLRARSIVLVTGDKGSDEAGLLLEAIEAHRTELRDEPVG